MLRGLVLGIELRTVETLVAQLRARSALAFASAALASSSATAAFCPRPVRWPRYRRRCGQNLALLHHVADLDTHVGDPVIGDFGPITASCQATTLPLAGRLCGQSSVCARSGERSAPARRRQRPGLRRWLLSPEQPGQKGAARRQEGQGQNEGGPGERRPREWIVMREPVSKLPESGGNDTAPRAGSGRRQ